MLYLVSGNNLSIEPKLFLKKEEALFEINEFLKTMVELHGTNINIYYQNEKDTYSIHFNDKVVTIYISEIDIEYRGNKILNEVDLIIPSEIPNVFIVTNPFSYVLDNRNYVLVNAIHFKEGRFLIYKAFDSTTIYFKDKECEIKESNFTNPTEIEKFKKIRNKIVEFYL